MIKFGDVKKGRGEQSIMSYADKITAEFDPEKRILHLQAAERLEISEKTQLDEVCARVSSILMEQCAEERCYMVVNLSCFVIDPSLAVAYGEKMQCIGAEYIYPDGVARYDYEITRVTISLSQTQYNKMPQNLFATRKDAYEYIDGLIEKSQKGKPRSSIEAT